MINVPFNPDDDDCVIGYSQGSPYVRRRNWNPDPLQITLSKHGGIEIPVGGKSVAIPLKAVFPVTCAGNVCDDSKMNWFEWFRLNIITGDLYHGTVTPVQSPTNDYQFEKPFDNTGVNLFPDYNTYASQFYHTFPLPGCSAGNARAFLGQRSDPFWINLGQIFDGLNLVPIPGFPGAVVEDNNRNNALLKKSITSFVLEVPIQCVTAPNGDSVISAWTSIRQLHHDGDTHIPGKQVSRLGSPLVNELVIGLRDKNLFNTAHPRDDGQFLIYVQYPTLPEIINIVFLGAVNCQLGLSLTTIAPKNFPRNDLVAAFLTGVDGINRPQAKPTCEMLRLNTATPVTPQASQSPYGVIGGDLAGFPNGRRPGDDAVDIALRVMIGVLCTKNINCTAADAPVGGVPLTDGAPVNASYFLNAFPYLQPPLPGAIADGGISGFKCQPHT